jgi:hypothetical protein
MKPVHLKIMFLAGGTGAIYEYKKPTIAADDFAARVFVPILPAAV